MRLTDEQRKLCEAATRDLIDLGAISMSKDGAIYITGPDGSQYRAMPEMVAFIKQMIAEGAVSLERIQ